MKITTVMDNRRGEQKSLTAEHGLSFLVETEKSRILFDFGAGKAAYDNACKLNIGMENIQYAVGSHGHYDHAGGYPEFVKEGLHCPLYTGTGYFEEKYARDGRKATYLGWIVDPERCRGAAPRVAVLALFDDLGRRYGRGDVRAADPALAGPQ